jgi:hypothetical protein
MTNAKIDRGKLSIQTAFVATAFAAVEAKPAAEDAKTAPGNKVPPKPSSGGLD